jgi:RNA polymerase sigma factor (sigma-70 family)
MTNERLTALVRKLAEGDTAAAAQVFLIYEPYLRVVVRRQLSSRLRAKLDSTDVVQSVFANALERFRDAGCQFRDPDHLRALLVTMTRNRFIDRLREHRAALDAERSLDAIDADMMPASRQPPPSEIAQAEELWDQLMDKCPPQHRELLRLKREGRPVSEIVQRTGLNDGSIRRILRRLARRLAFRSNSPQQDH